MNFAEEMKSFGVANWILIACVAFVMLMMIVLIIINIKIMKKYRVDLLRTRVARIATRIEVLDGWCCVVVENKGQEAATDVKVKCSGTIMKYYYNYISTCRVDNIVDSLLGSGFTLVSGDRKQIKLFPVKSINKGESVLDHRLEAVMGDNDVNLTGKTMPTDVVEIDEVFDGEDEKIIRSVAKEQKKLALLQAKQDAKYKKEADRIAKKKQDAIRKLNKKQQVGTHVSIIEQPDMSKLVKNANIKFSYTYESLGYFFKNKCVIRDIDLKDYPEEVRTAASILSAQNTLLEQIALLQKDIRDMLGETIGKQD